MTNPVKRIHQDHVSISKILNLIEREIDRARDEKMPNLELLEDAMRYMVNYPDLVHHRMEDSMFARLARNEPEVSDQVEALRREHVTLGELGGAFLDIVKAAQSGEFIGRKEVIDRGTEYVKTLRTHMNTEEAGLLKRAEAALSEQDLSEIQEEYASIRDPLMEKSLQDQYSVLYRTLFE